MSSKLISVPVLFCIGLAVFQPLSAISAGYPLSGYRFSENQSFNDVAQNIHLNSADRSASEAISEVLDTLPVGLASDYLPARYASEINDFSAALDYLRKVHAVDSHDLGILEQLVIFSVIAGQFDEALTYADKIIVSLEGHGISRMFRLAKAMTLSHYDQALEEVDALAGRGSGDLLVSILRGWVYLAQGRVEAALTEVRSVPSEGVASVIQDYHAAMIADLGGWPIVAANRYKAAFNNEFSGQRVGEAYINFLLRQGQIDLARSMRRVFEERFEGNFSQTLDRWFVDGQSALPLVGGVGGGMAEAFFDIGDVHFSDDNYKHAALYNRIALLLSPVYDRALIRMADIKLAVSQNSNVDDTDKAIGIYQAVTSDSRYYRHAQSQIGVAYLISARKIEAETHFKSLVQRFPDETSYFLQFGIFLSSEKRYDEAAELLKGRIDRLEVVNEDHSELFFRAGAAFERAKKWPQAEVLLKEALELDEDNGLILNYLGYSWVDRGENLTRALGMIEKAVKIRPTDGFIIDSLGWAYYRLKRFHLAVTYLEAAVSRSAADPHIQDHLGDAYWRVDRKDEARFQWNHALTLSPDALLEAQILLKLRDGLVLSSADKAPPVPIPPSPRQMFSSH